MIYVFAYYRMGEKEHGGVGELGKIGKK